ncbi:MAG: DNA polymerase III subunit chi [Betaproteobacteria bacterium]|nr:DNA polymerase III subunit chi [Betaproteobacteria bacterium]
MTEVKVFYNVPDKLGFACRLAKRAVDEGKRLIVFAPDRELADTFDRLLWTFQQLSFVPHVRAGHVLVAETPIVIASSDTGLHHHEALLNLADDPPPFFSRFEFLREVVSQDEADRAKARERLRFYKSRGFEVSNQDMGQAA